MIVSPVLVPGRRLVAVSMTSMELLRPQSDLARQLAGASRVDLLLACDDNQPPGGPDYGDADSVDDGPGAVEIDELSAAAARFGSTLHLHRLALHTLLGLHVEDDLIAALSELVGFDPAPDVYCLAPARTSSNPSHVVLERAVQRIAQVYGVPLLRYRCLELFAVGE
ncbi:MAG: hypothetical protein ACRDRH_27060 [Pseudonocardia sp.]